DKTASDNSYFPSDSEASLIYSLSIRDTNGNDVTYSENNVLNYMKENGLGNSLIFSNADEAENAAKKFRQSVEDTGAVIVGEYISTPIQPQVSITIMNQSTGEVEALVGGREDISSSLRSNRA